MRFMAYQHHKRTDSQTETVPRNQLKCTKSMPALFRTHSFSRFPLSIKATILD